MLSVLFPLLIALAILLPSVVIASIMRRQHPRWWSITLVRSLVWSLPALGLLCLAIGQWAPRMGYDPTQTPLAALIVLSLCTQLALLLALPISGAIVRRHTGRRKPPRPMSARNAALEEGSPGEDLPADPPHDPSRRRFLSQSLAAAVPLVMASGTAGAIAGTMNGARVRLKPLFFRNLPNHLKGLRILHLSDLHMGTFMTLPELASTLDRARRLSPHLVLITGDIADDLSLLPATMTMIAELDSPLGVFSCLGNHEYHAGVDRARDVLAAAPGTLLKNFGMPISWHGGDLFLAGVDDPLGRLPQQSPRTYLRNSLDFALGRRRPYYFTILLSHRPWVFDMSAPRGVELTLAGHTHGGQIGISGRSLLELDPHTRYPWGLYHLGNRQLYTSAGAGQWIPFRLGCPAEAPVFELWRQENEARNNRPIT